MQHVTIQWKSTDVRLEVGVLDDNLLSFSPEQFYRVREASENEEPDIILDYRPYKIVRKYVSGTQAYNACRICGEPNLAMLRKAAPIFAEPRLCMNCSHEKEKNEKSGS